MNYTNNNGVVCNTACLELVGIALVIMVFLGVYLCDKIVDYINNKEQNTKSEV